MSQAGATQQRSDPSQFNTDRTHPGRWTITFSNPPINMFVPTTIVELGALMTDLEADSSVKVVVFQSANPDFFIAHLDVNKAAERPEVLGLWRDFVLRLSSTPVVSIAKIRGRTRGIGNEFVLACDMRFASRQSALFGNPEIGVGLVPGGGALEWLPRLVGRSRALEIVLSGDDFDADIAERYGWVNRTLDDDDLDSFVDALVRRLASFDREALAAAKAQVYPLRAIREMVDEVLRALSAQFDGMYANEGRPSIAPERLLRAQLLQMLYSVRSERLLMEEIDYSMLFRWFVGLNLDEEVWDPTTFTKNRDRLLEAEVAKLFLAEVVEQARKKGLTSDEHFTVDGTLLEAWASLKSLQRKDGKNPPPDDPGNPTVNFHGTKRSNRTHESQTDPEAQLARKGEGKEAKLSYSGNLLVENRNGLIVNAMAWEANGTAERDAALLMLEQIPGAQRVTAGGDKGYDTRDFVAECRHMHVTPHAAQNVNRRGGSALDARTTRHEGYRVSQRKRQRIEECFGWLKTVALLRKLRHRGLGKVDWVFTFACAAYNLVRLRNLAVQPA